MSEGGDRWSVWPAPAKLNLFLRITGRRADGYHTLQTVFRLLDWGDSVRLRVRCDGCIGRAADDCGVASDHPPNRMERSSSGIELSSTHIPQPYSEIERSSLGDCGPDLTRRPLRPGAGSSSGVHPRLDTHTTISEGDDLSIKAAKLLQSAANVRQGADICVIKRIPVGGGFGGGSSDAATTLVALNALWGLGWPLGRLSELGQQLGADVPVFVMGQNAWAEGVGEQLTPIDLPRCWYVLVDPGVHASTAELFQAPELTRDSPPATISDFVSGVLLDNAFEPVVRRLESAVEAAFRAMSQIGRPRLTGSGSGCFVEFGDRESAQAGLAALPPGLRAWIAAGVSRSPLHVLCDTTS
ncbi:MAG: 4-(cytidine 5'-diphospho)-2-C-methyl-D-erythritol kinase [Luteimonas sp.]